jgi:hypothetical protein
VPEPEQILSASNMRLRVNRPWFSVVRIAEDLDQGKAGTDRAHHVKFPGSSPGAQQGNRRCCRDADRKD